MSQGTRNAKGVNWGVATGIIPARMGSTRLPQKALAVVEGKTLIRWVVENASRCRSLDRLLVACDHEAIAAEARLAGVEAVLTDPDHPSGTDRVAEAAAGVSSDLIVNIQGDEPEIDPQTIDAVVAMLHNNSDLDLTTAAAPIRTMEDFLSPQRVKVVCDDRGRALYFSRSPIPFSHQSGPSVGQGWPAGEVEALGHVGLYGYRRKALMKLVSLPPSPLEICEKLEQLRALQHGMSIGVAVVDRARPGIDVKADLEAFRNRVLDGHSGLES